MKFIKKALALAIMMGSVFGGSHRLVATDNQLIKTGLNIGGRIAAVYAGAMAGTIIHELGHAAAGLSVGIKPLHICIGTDTPRDENALISNKYITICRPLSLHPKVGGMTYFPDFKMKNYKHAIVSAGGPLTGLIATAVAWQFFKDNQTAKFLLTANALIDLSNFVPTLTGLWDFAADDGYKTKRSWRSDGDQLWEALGNKFNFNFEHIRYDMETTAAGRMGLAVLDLGLKLSPLYYYARTVIHK